MNLSDEVRELRETNMDNESFLASEAKELHEWLDRLKVERFGDDGEGNGYILPLIDRVIRYRQVCVKSVLPSR